MDQEYVAVINWHNGFGYWPASPIIGFHSILLVNYIILIGIIINLYQKALSIMLLKKFIHLQKLCTLITFLTVKFNHSHT